jgi:hypothetical protein
MTPIRTERIGDKTVPVLIWPDGSWIHLMAHDIDGGQKPAEQLERWLKAWLANGVRSIASEQENRGTIYGLTEVQMTEVIAVPGRTEPPAVGTPVLCMVCAHEKPWGVCSPQGAAVCIECRDKARASSAPSGRQADRPDTRQPGNYLYRGSPSEWWKACRILEGGVMEAGWIAGRMASPKGEYHGPLADDDPDWLAALKDEPMCRLFRELAAPAPSGGQAAQPAEPSERELPDRPGVWFRKDMGGDVTLVYKSPGGLCYAAVSYSGSFIDGGFVDELPRGHWRPAVPDTDAYADAEKLVEEILGAEKLTYLQLRAERDRLREQVEAVRALADKWASRSVQLAPRVGSIVGGPEWTAAKYTQMACDEHASELRAALAERTP